MLWLARSLELDQPSQELSRVIRTNMAVWRAHCFPLIEFLPDQGRITGAVFSPDGKMLLTGIGDGIARLWIRRLVSRLVSR